MRCERCGFESSTPTRYCGGCGALQTSPCSSCGEYNPLDFRYCGSCGTVLPIRLPEPSTAPSAEDLPAERRQLTVMFCDLVGSTSLSALLDPEELREIVRAYQDAAARVIERYDGYVAQYLGDGVLAYFGYPAARENEASRAVRAARELIGAIRELNRRPEHPPEVTLSARVGIHTGVVVVGEIGGGRRREHLALGETPNVAARIQAAAEPDEVVLSAETHGLIRGEFACTSLGARPVRGLPEPLELYRVVEEITGDLSLLLPSSRVPLVGREHERRHLHERWLRAAAGTGALVRVTGEAGLVAHQQDGRPVLGEDLPQVGQDQGRGVAEQVDLGEVADTSSVQPVRDRHDRRPRRHPHLEDCPRHRCLLGHRSRGRPPARPARPRAWCARTA